MSGPFATPTVRATNPLEDALAADAMPRAPQPPSFTASPPPRPSYTSSRTAGPLPSKPPLSQRTSGSAYARARSPPTKRMQGNPAAGRGGGAVAGQPVHPQADASFRTYPQALGQPGAPPRSTHPQAHAHHQQAQPKEEDLVRFADLCRQLYYDKSDTAAQRIDATLGKLPPSFRTAYARTMAAVRADFHRDDEIRRRRGVETLLASIAPAQSVKTALGISPTSDSVAAHRSSRAWQVRREGLKAFLDANCVKAMPGTHPFFKSLFAALWLQGLPSSKGGAGARCVEWEVDVAVFTEAGGGDGWAREAVEALKGVLGMSERICEPSETDTTRTSFFESTSASSRASSIADLPIPFAIPELDPSISAYTNGDQAEPCSRPSSGADEHRMLRHEGDARDSTSASRKKPAPPVPPHRASLRSRSKSDPFLTPEEKAEKQQHAIPPAAVPSSPDSPPPPSPDPAADDVATPFLASTTVAPSPAPPPALPVRQLPSFATPSSPRPLKPQFRTFMLPAYLTDPECRSLCRLFPDFISSPAKPSARFRSNSASKAAAAVAAKTPSELEAGEGKATSMSAGAAASDGKVGHGELRIGKDERKDGWRGTIWERFAVWFKGLFGQA
ncbi:hypothetical protein JCM10213_002159 [Rhodosporidiobolus nylandii]